jgi:hypothetical protein
VTPTERLLTILRLISDLGDGGRKPVSSSKIQNRMGDEYAGEAGSRKWRRDIRTLRDRGLIETDLSMPDTPNRTGIRLRIPPKPERLHLTEVEHQAIGRAREALRPGISAVSPLGEPGADQTDVDYAARILRHLEENDDEVELIQLASRMGLSESDVYGLVDVLKAESVDTDGLVRSVEFGYADEEEGPTTVRVFRGRTGRRSPTRGVGMDEIGFFPYSLAETDDRLALIDDALQVEALIGDRKSLESARDKLAEWRAHLPSGGAMS